MSSFGSLSAFRAVSAVLGGAALCWTVLAPALPAAAQEAPAPTPGIEATAWTGEADQTDVAVTIYNNNLGLVRDRRKVTLPTGEHRLLFSDVAQQIRPETVSLDSTARPGSIAILEQNYEFDLISPSKLMEKYVGRRVGLIGFDRDQRFERLTAELLSVNEGPVYRIENDIYLGHPGSVVLPEMPRNLVARPSLVWLLVNNVAEQEIEATYLTYGMRWNADYVVKLDEADDRMDLKGWVTLTNESGANFTDARLKLVAGDVNIIQPPAALALGGGIAMDRMMAAEAAPPMQQEAFAEYHLYTLPRRTTIRQNQSKQVSLLEASNVPVEKRYELESHPPVFVPVRERQDERVGVILKFDNREEGGLGMPLPGGVMRVYQEDSEGMLQFSGEDRIEHTPRNEEVRLRVGRAFDVVAERRQTDFQRVADDVSITAFEIALRNHKDQPVTVDVIEHIQGDWEILESSVPHEKRDAATAVFSIEVPADGETVLTYRVQISLGGPRPLPLGRPMRGSVGVAPGVAAPQGPVLAPAPTLQPRPDEIPPDTVVSSPASPGAIDRGAP